MELRRASAGWLIVSLLTGTALSGEPAPAQALPRGPVKVILDTDIGSDCDDVGALAVLHALADRGEAEVLAVMVCNSAEYGPPCVDAINTYYGRPDLPIGAWKGGRFAEPSRYHRTVAEQFAGDLKSARDAPDAVALYRRILAGLPDGSAVLVTVGTLNNLHHLLLADAALVRRKVRRLVVMGGGFPGGREPNFCKPPEAGPSTKYVVENWPTPILFSGKEIGGPIRTGQRLFTETPEGNPVREAYRLYFRGRPANRSSWDQTAVLAAVRGPGPYWKVVTGGHCHVEPDGSNQWRKSPHNPNHAYLAEKMPLGQVARAIEDLMVRPPGRDSTK